MNGIESDLATMASDVHLHAPAEEVLTRGDRIRRRRHRRMAFGGAVVAAGAAAVATVVLPTNGLSGLPPAAAAWGPEPVNMQGTELAAATRVCADIVADLGVADMPTGLEPTAADQNAGYAVLVYRWNDTLVDCVLKNDSGHFVPDSIGAEPWVELPEDTAVASVALTYRNGAADDGVPDSVKGINGGSFIARVADNVAAVYLDVDGKLYRAEVSGGFATLWLPPGLTERQADTTATIRAFDSDGNEIEASRMEGLTPYGGGAVPGDD